MRPFPLITALDWKLWPSDVNLTFPLLTVPRKGLKWNVESLGETVAAMPLNWVLLTTLSASFSEQELAVVQSQVVALVSP